MTIIGTIYKTKSGRVFVVRQQQLINRKGFLKFYSYDEVVSENDLRFLTSGACGYEKTKSEVLQIIIKKY